MREEKQIKKEDNVQMHITKEVSACTHIHERRK